MKTYTAAHYDAHTSLFPPLSPVHCYAWKRAACDLTRYTLLRQFLPIFLPFSTLFLLFLLLPFSAFLATPSEIAQRHARLVVNLRCTPFFFHPFRLRPSSRTLPKSPNDTRVSSRICTVFSFTLFRFDFPRDPFRNRETTFVFRRESTLYPPFFFCSFPLWPASWIFPKSRNDTSVSSRIYTPFFSLFSASTFLATPSEIAKRPSCFVANLRCICQPPRFLFPLKRDFGGKREFQYFRDLFDERKIRIGGVSLSRLWVSGSFDSGSREFLEVAWILTAFKGSRVCRVRRQSIASPESGLG